MLRWRIVLGAVFIAALIGLMWLDFMGPRPVIWLYFLALAVGLAAAREVVDLLASGGYTPLPSAIYGGTALVITSNAIPLFWLETADEKPLERLAWPLVAFIISALAALAGEMWRYRRPGGVIANAALAIFGVTYIGLLLSFALQLRVLGGPVAGMVALISLIVVVKFADIGAYTVGRLIGRHKLAPLLSPGKTIEGALGALVFACIAAWFCLSIVPQWMGIHVNMFAKDWIVYGVIVGGAGILGDLAESLFKRDMRCKDSSTWLPGFGGVLDLVDSVLFAAPVAYLCWLTAIF